MEEYQIRHQVRTHAAPEGTRRNPDSVRRLWERWEAGGISKPKDLESILTTRENDSHTLDMLADILVAAQRVPAPKPLGRIVCGQVPLGRFEAFVLPMDDGGNAIVLDTFLEGFLTFSSFAGLACGFEKPSAEEVDRYTHGVFRELDKFLGFGTWDLQDDLFNEMAEKNYNGAVMAGYTQMAMTTFILAHEIAHVLLGHTKATRRMSMCRGGENIPIEVLVTSHAEELAADDLAWGIYQEIVRDAEAWPTTKIEALYDAVPLYLFDLLAVLNARFEVVKREPPFDPDHPSPQERKAKLLAAHPEMLHDWSRTLYDGLGEFAEHLLENCASFPASDITLPKPRPIDL
jgi:hypothetical protein